MNPNSKILDESFFMQLAIHLALRAAEHGEVPVGAVLVKEGRIIAEGANLTKTKKDATLHAEIVVIQKAAKHLKNERLLGTVLYVTLEPCAMCAGAIVQARIPRVVFGARDPKAGACGSVLNVIPNQKLNHRPQVMGGIMSTECETLLKAFFRQKRKNKVSYQGRQ